MKVARRRTNDAVDVSGVVMLCVDVFDFRLPIGPASTAFAFEYRAGNVRILAAHDAHGNGMRVELNLVLSLLLVRVVLENHDVENAVEFGKVRLDVCHCPVRIDGVGLNHTVEEFAVRLNISARDARCSIDHRVPPGHDRDDLRDRTCRHFDASMFNGRKFGINRSARPNGDATRSALAVLVPRRILHDRAERNNGAGKPRASADNHGRLRHFSFESV